MKFVFTTPAHDQVQGTLDEGEAFGYHTGPTTFDIGMAPGNRDFDALFPNADAETDPATNTVVAKSWGDPAHPVEDFVPPPAGPVVVNKVDFYNRMTEKEAEDVELLISKQSVKNRRIFESASTFRSDYELWDLLNSLADTVFTPERKAVILAPS
jgi:hypothetical protein